MSNNRSRFPCGRTSSGGQWLSERKNGRNNIEITIASNIAAAENGRRRTGLTKKKVSNIA